MLASWPVPRRIAAGIFVLTSIVVSLAVFSQRSIGELGDGHLEYTEIA